MTALLDKADQMASMDWRVAPVPWRQHLANPGRPLKVAMLIQLLKIVSMHRLGITRRMASSHPPQAWSGGSRRLSSCCRMQDTRSTSRKHNAG